MTIAYLINQYPQASQSFIRREIAALEALGIRVERFTVRRWDQKLVDAGDLAEQAKTRGVLEAGKVRLFAAAVGTALGRPVKFFRAFRVALRLGRRSRRGVLVHLAYLVEACLLRRWLVGCGAVHVHAHFGTNSTAVALLVERLGGPGYSFTTHGPEEFDRPEDISLGEKIERSRFAAAVSSFGRSQLYRWCGHAHWDKIHVIRCGVDEAFLCPEDDGASAEPPFPLQRRLVCVGRLEEQKGQLLLVRAAGLLSAAGTEFELVLVGDGTMRRVIDQEIARLGLGDRVRLAGWVSNDGVRRELLGARALVLASFAEGLPVVVMEALALGRPVVTTAVAGIPELVEDGSCGYLVPAGNVERLAEAMRQVLEADADHLAQLGRAGRHRVREWHDARKGAAALAALFHQMATAPPGRGSIPKAPQ